MTSRGLGRKNSKVVRLRVPIELLDSWQHFIEDNKEDGAEVLRRVMAQLVGRPRREASSQDTGTSVRQVRETSEVDRAPKKAVKLMLTPSEHAALSEIAEDRACSIQFWIVSLVRSALTRGITVGGAELIALGESNYELAAIGRNLNQIARRLNAETVVDSRELEPMLRALGENLETHRGKVHALVNACSHRWKLVPGAS